MNEDYVVKRAVELINEAVSYLNQRNHLSVETIIHEFDKICHGRSLPVDIIFKRLQIHAEWALRTGRSIDECLSEISAHLPLFDKMLHQRFQLLMKAGELERIASKLHVSSSFIIEALVLAEDSDNNNWIIDVYSAVSDMFALRYPGLAIYFIRKAEILSANNGFSVNLYKCQMKRALLSFVVAQSYEKLAFEQSKKLFTEARKIVLRDYEEGLCSLERKYFQYIKAYVQGDEEEMLSLYKDACSIDAFPDESRYLEAYLGICLEKGLWDKALAVLPQYRQNLISSLGNLEIANSCLESIQHIIQQAVPARFIPFHLSRSSDEPVTLFDILDHYSLQDELWALEKGHIRAMFPSYPQEGKFEVMDMMDGTSRLIPRGLAFNVYYRGQSEYFEECFPSLYRKGMTPAKRFIERIRLVELQKCMNSNPIISLYRHGIEARFIDGSSAKITLCVDELALAQHYGIKTELIDLTTDKFVAAFFATTQYKDGEYTPILDKRKSKGVLYRFCDTCFNSSGLSAVGLQPFSRPGEQKGLVYKMDEGQNFNHMVQSKDFFEHDPEVSQFIFNYMNRSKKLFPLDSLTKHADAIVKATTLSTSAYYQAKESFYCDVSDEVLKNYLQEENIDLSENVDFCFSKQEQNESLEYWNQVGRKRMLSQMYIRSCVTFSE